jgi:phytoene/squalene synthetase
MTDLPQPPLPRGFPADLEPVWHADPDRLLAAAFAPVAVRTDLARLYALNLELALVAERTREEMVGRIRLAWWGEALDDALGGGAVRPHPVLLAAVPILRRLPDAARICAGMIAARERDLDPTAFATWEDLETYIDATAGGTTTLALACCGIGEVPAATAGQAVGRAWGLTGLIRAQPYWQKRGRQVWPVGQSGEVLPRARAALVRARQAVRGLHGHSGSAAFPAIGHLALVTGYLARPQRPRSLMARQLRLVGAALFGV